MRSLSQFAFACLLVAAFVATPLVAHADEVDDGTIEARRLGRLLIASDSATRNKALDALLALIGEDPARLGEWLREACSSAAVWANRAERLEEVWRETAIEGSTSERRRAVRLLHALGPDAVERLTQEIKSLRTMRRQPGARAAGPLPPSEPQVDEASSAEGEDDATDDAPADAQPPLAEAAGAGASTPALPHVQAPATAETPLEDSRLARMYDVARLRAKGKHGFALRRFLQLHADASEVVELGGSRWMVIAEAPGHAKLTAAIEAELAKDAANGGKAGAKAAESGTAVQSVPGKAGSLALTAYAWAVPQGALEAMGVVPGASQKSGSAELPVGNKSLAKDWLETLRKTPDARQIDAWSNEPLALGESAEFFIGRVLPYNRSIVERPGGAYAIETAELQHGHLLRIHARRGESAETGPVELEIEAGRMVVLQPIPTFEVRPTKDGPAVTLHSPTWSRTERALKGAFAAEGGAVRIALQGIDGIGGGQPLVIVLVAAPR